MRKLYLLIGVSVLVLFHAGAAQAVPKQMTVYLQPTFLMHEDVFGYQVCPLSMFELYFIFDTDDDIDPSPEFLSLPAGKYTLQGEWKDADGAGWDETMHWPETSDATINVNLFNSRFLNSHYWTNPLNNQLQINSSYNSFRMIDSSVGMNNILSGDISHIAVTTVYVTENEDPTWGMVKSLFD